MRVALTLEAHDKASRAVRNMANAVTGLNKSAVTGANKAAAATAKATKAVEGGTKATEKADKATREAGKASIDSARKAARGQQLVARAAQALNKSYNAAGRGARVAGNAARTAGQMAAQGWQRAQVALDNYAKKQAKIARAGLGQMGSGAQQVGHGLVAGGKVAAGVATGAGVLGGAAAAISSFLVKPMMDYERFMVTLTKTELSADKARKALAWVDDFATRTPFEVMEVTDAFVKMRTYALNPMNGSLKDLGDAAFGMGKPLMQFVEALGDAVNGQNERLVELGITASKVGKHFVYSFANEKNERVSIKAEVGNAKAIEQALRHIWRMRWAGGMEDASQTFEGMLSNIQDAIGRFQRSIAKAGLFDWMKGRLGEVLEQLDAMAASGELQEWATGISKALQEGMAVGWEAAKGLGKALLAIARAAKAMADAMGGWENFAYLALAAAFSGPLLSVASGLFLLGKGAVIAVTALGKLAGAKALLAGMRGLPALLMGMARGMLAIGAAGARGLVGVFAGVARGVTLLAGAGLKALPGLLMAAARGFMVLGASIMATPVGWVIAGIAAIAAAAYLIYANWDSIGPWLAGVWEGIKTTFSDAWAAISGFDWSSILPDFEWSSLLPSWDWLQLIPAIALPSFAWRELLPDWDWSSIIPSMPDFGSYFGSWLGGAATPAAPAAPALAADPKALAEQAALAQKAIEALRPAAQAAVAAASAVLAGTSFHSHGVALMATLAAGIKAGAGAAVGAVQGVTQQMRDYLPHSPAKVGPLSDLDKIRFSETLAGAIRPGPAVAAARSVAAGMRAAVAAPVTAGLMLSPSPVSAGLPIGGAGGTDGSGAPVSVSVQYSPSVSIAAGTAPQQAASFEAQLRAHADVLARMVDEQVRRAQRKEF